MSGLGSTKNEVIKTINRANENLSPIDSLIFCLQKLACDDDLILAIAHQINEGGSGAIRKALMLIADRLDSLP